MEGAPGVDDKNRSPLYSTSYKTTDFVWAQSLGEGKIFKLLFLKSEGINSSFQ